MTGSMGLQYPFVIVVSINVSIALDCSLQMDCQWSGCEHKATQRQSDQQCYIPKSLEQSNVLKDGTCESLLTADDAVLAWFGC